MLPGDRVNMHATALVVGQAGLLIRGMSGAGKSSLAAALIDACRARLMFARLVADDRTWISVSAGRLISEVPEPIAGLIEIRGHGPVAIDYERRMVVDAVIDLVDPAHAPRHREPAQEHILGLPLPRLNLPAGNPEGGSRAVLAWLDSGEAGPASHRKW